MQSPHVPWPRRVARWLVVPVALAAVGVVVAMRAAPAETRPDREDPIAVVEDGELVYVFDAISGRESLFDRRSDPDLRSNLARGRTTDVERLRERLLRSRRIGTLEELREVHRDQIERLRALGYL